MRKTPLISHSYALIPLGISGIVTIAIFFLLWYNSGTNTEYVERLQLASGPFMAISGGLCLLIVLYLLFTIGRLRQNQDTNSDLLTLLTQKMHHFRSIVELLMNSKMWMPGLKEYIDDEFEGLTFFEVKEFYKGKSKLAIEFLQENSPYQDTENLYLELKSLLMTDLRERRVKEQISHPSIYPNEMVQKWLEHKCGSGLWYYFGYKYASYKEALNYEAVYERHQEKIMTLAYSIDGEAFEDSSFNEVFLSKLGEYMTNEVIPRLFQLQSKIRQSLPAFVNYLYGLFLALVLFGLSLPLAYRLFQLPEITLMVSFAFVSGIFFFITFSLYPFLKNQFSPPVQG
ncbi:hypothetical protein [Aureitalea marina]|uniref:Uncharacterized protein n=1 Tax=Aureitalea marina TaxID=930804 RepID=A0A2S7KNR8_9FLAO|nr:hypothetical protein [Aureitalea marina]PQB04213.1 hypothetical protein BST85_04320 [Aureitalea marina]